MLAPWWVTVSMPTGQPDWRTYARQLRYAFCLDAASVIRLIHYCTLNYVTGTRGESTLALISTLTAYGRKRNITVLCLSRRHTHRDSPGGSMRRGQHTFWPDNKEFRYTCFYHSGLNWCIMCYRWICWWSWREQKKTYRRTSLLLLLTRTVDCSNECRCATRVQPDHSTAADGSSWPGA